MPSHEERQLLQQAGISALSAGEVFKLEDVAARYDASLAAIRGQDYEKEIEYLVGLATWLADDVVVDLGCGTGISTALVLRHNPKLVIGVDFSEPMIKRAREKV